MKRVNAISAILLAIPLIVFGANYFLNFIQPPPDTSIGMDMLNSMREGGLMVFVALAHIVIGFLLLYGKTRFLAALLHFPISLGIVLFHITMMPAGLPLATFLLITNALVLVDKERMASIL